MCLSLLLAIRLLLATRFATFRKEILQFLPENMFSQSIWSNYWAKAIQKRPVSFRIQTNQWYARVALPIKALKFAPCCLKNMDLSPLESRNERHSQNKNVYTVEKNNTKKIITHKHAEKTGKMNWFTLRNAIYAPHICRIHGVLPDEWSP